MLKRIKAMLGRLGAWLDSWLSGYEGETIEHEREAAWCKFPMCTTPPEGWFCSRGKGHEGPCAAYSKLLHRPVPIDPYKTHYEAGVDPATGALTLCAYDTGSHEPRVLCTLDKSDPSLPGTLQHCGLPPIAWPTATEHWLMRGRRAGLALLDPDTQPHPKRRE